jgi:hypothetical protein
MADKDIEQAESEPSTPGFLRNPCVVFGLSGIALLLLFSYVVIPSVYMDAFYVPVRCEIP